VEARHLESEEEPYKLSRKVLGKATRAFRDFGMEKLNNIVLLRNGKVTPLFHCLKDI
jgi:hypothetical protein